MEANESTVAGQIKVLLDNLREDVAVAKQRHTDADLALRDALAQFKPQPIGRPPGAAKIKRTRKAKAEKTDTGKEFVNGSNGEE